ncbi:MAG TPA: FtsX-like permease family protein [Phycisphaerae bacterium]|nr:FtsX-like permease family protein [Phycisphaerae bacterium]
MYKLFLSLKYLLRRPIGYFAVLGVAVCVFMMLTVVSVMNGFVDKIERAAKGLFGDVIVEPAGWEGLAYYDEFIAQMRKDWPGRVEAASPFLLSYGILRIPGQAHYREGVQIAGIRLPERIAVTEFELGLHFQRARAAPDFDPPRGELLGAMIREIGSTLIETLRELGEPPASSAAAGLAQRARALTGAMGLSPAQAADLAAWMLAWDRRGESPPAQWRTDETHAALFGRMGELAAKDETRPAACLELADRFLMSMLWGRAPTADNPRLGKLQTALSFQRKGLDGIYHADRTEQRIAVVERKMREAETQPASPDEQDRLSQMLSELEQQRFRGPRDRVILGLGIAGLSFRTPRGQTVRTMTPGQNVVLYVFPLGQGGDLSRFSPNPHTFTVIDDCRTDVSSIDSAFVYVPFEALQKLNNMGPELDPAGKVVRPGRCSQIHIKVRPGLGGEAQLRTVAAGIEQTWRRFAHAHPDASRTDVLVQTWRQRQAKLVGQIESQRTLMVLILAIISSVAIVLIFVILYTVVVQKTRDIGVLKAVGASSGGVAGIFLAYGAAIGLVGSALGAVGGYFLVRNINPVHDWLGRTTGFTVWDPEWFLFDQIPNEVRAATAVLIVAAAVAAGVLGAMFPAVRAARMQPVEALRYE